MGCAQSTAHGERPADFVPPSRPSSVAVNDEVPATAAHGHTLLRISSQIQSPPSPQPQVTSARSRHRLERNAQLSHVHNQPLAAHIWEGNHKFTRSLPGPNSRRTEWTRRSLDYEREAFFDTQTQGRPEIWGTLKMATGLVRQGDLATAQGVIDAAEVTLPWGDLAHGAYDSHGDFYEMPEWAVADPPKIIEVGTTPAAANGMLDGQYDSEVFSGSKEMRREAKGKAVLRPAESMDIKARFSDGTPDVTVRIGKEEHIRVLIRRVREDAVMPADRNIRILYLGKILKENQTLKSQGYIQGHVVNAMIS